MEKTLLITVGTGTGTDRAILFSIRNSNPGRLACLVTAESREKTLSLVTAALPETLGPPVVYQLDEHNDLETIALRCREIIAELGVDNLVVDFTFGTKAMSAGLVAAAVEMGVNTISYVHGERDSRGVVRTGTERLHVFAPNRLYAQRAFYGAVKLFNEEKYEGARDLAAAAGQLYAGEDFRRRCDCLDRLSQAYLAWDRFQAAPALAVLKKLSAGQAEMLARWQVKGAVERHKEILHFETTDRLHPCRAFVLVENAARKARAGYYEDAVARLYRALEFLAQVRISGLGLYRLRAAGPDTREIDVEKLVREYPALKEKYTAGPVKTRLGLVGNYELLADAGDPPGRHFIDRFRCENDSLHAALGARNNSILAHGFEPADEKVYAKVKGVVDDLLAVPPFGTEGRRYQAKVGFPVIVLS